MSEIEHYLEALISRKRSEAMSLREYANTMDENAATARSDAAAIDVLVTQAEDVLGQWRSANDPES